MEFGNVESVNRLTHDVSFALSRARYPSYYIRFRTVIRAYKIRVHLQSRPTCRGTKSHLLDKEKSSGSNSRSGSTENGAYSRTTE